MKVRRSGCSGALSIVGKAYGFADERDCAALSHSLRSHNAPRDVFSFTYTPLRKRIESYSALSSAELCEALSVIRSGALSLCSHGLIAQYFGK